MSLRRLTLRTRRKGGGKRFCVRSGRELVLTQDDSFYYADERTPEGKPMGHTPNAESHAAMYLQLAQDNTGKFPTYVTFAQGEYRAF